ncbi:OLC1v1001703C1 [Oldenlandia corymbosa var. corymbosa]|uniref:Splicing factor YJU2 n=1 Tax=Oldenlandia corymbosa var. corymbosa TaxID=529605 RepID=A0AAV1D619_OLDCO|nr:OLC1v1001703C1 [Oldenlandia corymbosa var. corymbosa]
MGERKVLNKYYPPDFDPSKVRRRSKPLQMTVRMMLPMSIRCATCGNYMSKGTKFNIRKEDVAKERYLDCIQIFRLYFKCNNCSAEITIKTDPKNSDYVVESGAKRNFEPWRADDEEEDKEKRKREAEEMGDSMKSLENRTLESKRQLDMDAALAEIKSMKSRQATLNVADMLDDLQSSRRSQEEIEKELSEEDEALVRSIFNRTSNHGLIVRRINDEDIADDDDGYDFRSKRTKLDHEQTVSNPLGKDKVDVSAGSSNGKNIIFRSPAVRVSVKKKESSGVKVKGETVEGSTSGSAGLQSLFQQYESEDGD